MVSVVMPTFCFIGLLSFFISSSHSFHTGRETCDIHLNMHSQIVVSVIIRCVHIDHLFAPVNDESSTCKTAGINIEDVKPGRLNFKPGCHEVVVFAVTSLGVQAAYEDIAVTQ